MKLVHLIYASKYRENLNFSDIKEILKEAQANNKTQDITGFLCFGNGYFLQILEGDAHKVNQLFYAISKDPRHQELMLLDYSKISIRDFVDWSMGHWNIRQEDSGLILKYSTSAVFDPFEMSGEGALGFLQALKELRT